MPCVVEITGNEIYECLKPLFEELTGAASVLFERTTPQPVSYTHLDVYKRQVSQLTLHTLSMRQKLVTMLTLTAPAMLTISRT